MKVILDWKKDEISDLILTGFYDTTEECLAMLYEIQGGSYGIIVYPSTNDVESLDERFSTKQEAMEFAMDCLREHGFVSVYDKIYLA